MSDVYVYDHKLAPATSGLIQIIETDTRGVRIDLQANHALGSLYGASVKQPTPVVPVGIWVDDKGGVFAPMGFEFLNPSSALRLDVTLFPLPAPVIGGGSGGGGGGGGVGHGSGGPGGAGDPNDIVEPEDAALAKLSELTLRRGARWRFGFPVGLRGNAAFGMHSLTAVAELAHWSDAEQRAVSSLIRTIAAARMLVRPSEDFERRLRRWESTLRQLGIDIAETRGGRGSGGNNPLERLDIVLPHSEGEGVRYEQLRDLEMEE